MVLIFVQLYPRCTGKPVLPTPMGLRGRVRANNQCRPSPLVLQVLRSNRRQAGAEGLFGAEDASFGQCDLAAFVDVSGQVLQMNALRTLLAFFSPSER